MAIKRTDKRRKRRPEIPVRRWPVDFLTTKTPTAPSAEPVAGTETDSTSVSSTDARRRST